MNKRSAKIQAYKDMANVVKTVSPFGDPYFDVWDISRSKVFSRQSENLNKKLTFL